MEPEEPTDTALIEAARLLLAPSGLLDDPPQVTGLRADLLDTIARRLRERARSVQASDNAHPARPQLGARSEMLMP